MADINGTPGDDTLVGTPDNDNFDGGAGADTMSGLAGDDFYLIDNAGDQAIEEENEGYDTLLTSVNYTIQPGTRVEALWAGVSGLVLTGNEFNTELRGTAGFDTLNGGDGNDTLFGFGSNDILNGDAGDDQINGGAGNDVMNGGEGADRLDGGIGADSMTGGNGADTYYVDDAGDRTIEVTPGARDIAFASISYTLETNQWVEVLAATVSGLILTGNNRNNDMWGTDGADTLHGGDGNDFFSAGGGDDFLNGGNGNDTFLYGTGADTMTGGTGNDTYYVGEVGDRVIEAAGEGSDIVYALIDYTLAPGLSVEVLAAAADGLTLAGNELANDVWGHNGPLGDTLLGGAGNDALSGLGGNDILDGGPGMDTMFGGPGNDFYYVDDGFEDTLEKSGEGFDIVYASVSFDLRGSAGFTGAHPSSIEVLWAAVSGLVLKAYVFPVDFWGSSGTDVFVGGDGADAMSGLDGDDFLHGGGGSDSMIGGLGNDTYVVGQAGDQVYERAGEGLRDVVEASVSYTLRADAEVEIFWARAAGLTLTGNDFAQDFWGHDGGADTILGGGGADSMSGFGGDDILDGGLGNDSMIGGAGLDSYRFTTALGADNVDNVYGFVVGQDKIGLSDTIFGMPEGALAPGAFRTGAAAADADDRIIYDPATGQLLYDSDGVGGAGAVLFARLDANLNLSAGDFTVI